MNGSVLDDSNDNNRQVKLQKKDGAKFEALRQALIEGEQSGEPTPFDFDEFIKQMHEKHGRKK